MPLSRPEHPDIRGARFVLFEGFPYLAFYAVKGRDVVVVSVEYATRDYVDRVAKRFGGPT
jgi:plasmid stabilization system protein ParE